MCTVCGCGTATQEGDKAKAVSEAYSLTPIGRVTGVTVRLTNTVQPFHELGQRFAALQARAEDIMSDLAYLEKELQDLELQKDA